MSVHSTGNSKGARKLAISVSDACSILNVGRDRLYELMRDGTVLSYLDGGKRQIDLESVEAHHQRQLEAAKEFRTRKPHGAC